MSKQSFVTGQVLTAQQVNDLQSNDFNQTVSAKTASYTLVAADKGTRITMSNASATTITVNTSLFSAGDTLFISNLGAGVCTITAGTATVATASSLALAQHENGTLFFTSEGVSTFYKSAGATSGGMTLLSTTTLSGITTTVSSIDQTYKNLVVYVIGSDWQSANSTVFFNCNISTVLGSKRFGDSTFSSQVSATTKVLTVSQVVRGTGNNFFVWTIENYASTTAFKTFFFSGIHLNTNNISEFSTGGIRSTTAVDSITFGPQDGYNMVGGTIQIFGVK